MIPDDHTILLVLEQGGRIVGTVQGTLATRANGHHWAEIARLLIHPNARRRGHARRLIAAIEAELAVAGRWLVVLDTRAGDPSNAPYRAFGYVGSGRISDYACSSEGSCDATILCHKHLTGASSHTRSEPLVGHIRT